jgi:hypothetical protein
VTKSKVSDEKVAEVEKLKALGTSNDDAEAMADFAAERGMGLVDLISKISRLVAALRSGDLATVLSLLLELVGTSASAPKK